MNHHNRKTRITSMLVFMAVMVPFGVLFSFFIGKILEQYSPEADLQMLVQQVLMGFVHHPLSIFSFSRYTGLCLLVFMVLYLIFISYSMDMFQNKRPGEEAGSAKWAEPGSLQLEDKHGYNRSYSQRIRIGLNELPNNNALIIGGSGMGKSFQVLWPCMFNLYSRSVLFGRKQPIAWTQGLVITDPKKEIIAKYGKFLQSIGYRICTLDFIDMEQSDRLNPLSLVDEQEEILSLIQSIFDNTNGTAAMQNTPSGGKDPFWERAEQTYLNALFLLVKTYPKEKQTFRTIMELMSDGNGRKIRKEMERLKKQQPNHPAISQYNKVTAASEAAETISTILLCANTRLSIFENPKVLRILDENDFRITDLGLGINGDESKPMALLICTPDNDAVYNPVVGVYYNTIIRKLTRTADALQEKSLPIPVTFWLDEFANIKMPDSFLRNLATCRSRNISFIPIVQDITQLKGIYGETMWEQIAANCSVLVYLGSNSPSTNEWICKLLDKETIVQSGQSISYNSNGGGSSRNDSVSGRELATAGEIRQMPKKDCIVIITGMPPVYDRKYQPMRNRQMRRYLKSKDFGSYIHQPIDMSGGGNKKPVITYGDLSDKVPVQLMSESAQARAESIPVDKLVAGDGTKKEITSWSKRFEADKRQMIEDALAAGVPEGYLTGFATPDMTKQELASVISAFSIIQNGT